jgi:uncharacterized membrane protein
VAADRPPRWLSLGSLSLALLGLAVSVYLTVEHYTASTTLACPGAGAIDCVKVTTSAQSRFLGAPVALLGALFFVAMVALTLPVTWRWRARAFSRTRIGLTVLGVAFVIYLIYVELFVVDAICLWCTAVHIITIALFVLLALGAAATASAED